MDDRPIVGDLTKLSYDLITMKIAIQGELGAFSHQAALEMVPHGTIVPCARSAEVFERLHKKTVNAAIIPIENTLAGSVAEHYDLLLSNDVFIQREHHLRIVHNLIAQPGVKLNQIKRIYSHPIALDQCRDFLQKHPQIESIPFYDTAGSVRHIMENNLMDAAGIASELAATQYKAQILRKSIEDNKQNFTRFFLIQRQHKVLPEANKTSIAFAIKNEPGVLFKALSVFALRDISLSKIESRPVRGKPWQYVFYIDILCGDNDLAHNALRHLREVASLVKVLGVYPKAPTTS